MEKYAIIHFANIPSDGGVSLPGWIPALGDIQSRRAGLPHDSRLSICFPSEMIESRFMGVNTSMDKIIIKIKVTKSALKAIPLSPAQIFHESPV